MNDAIQGSWAFAGVLICMTILWLIFGGSRKIALPASLVITALILSATAMQIVQYIHTK